MHDRSVFKLRPPNYEELAKKYPEFRNKCFVGAGGKICVNFSDPNAVRLLSHCLLRDYFELDVQIPLGALVPRIPQRLNYILLLEDLIAKNSLDLEGAQVWGIDIGTGTSCIFPLLGSCLNNKWHFVGTEIDESALCCAEQNIARNHMEARIQLVRASADGAIFKEGLARHAHKQFTFSMCNPPFFDPLEASQKFIESPTKSSLKNFVGVEQKNDSKLKPPRSATTATPNEIIYSGGEQAFVKQMLDESISIGQKISLYTTMIGKLASLRYLQGILAQNGIRFAVHTLSQGKTTRWVLVWTFCDNIETS